MNAKKRDHADDALRHEIVPSDLGDSTHAEMLMLYQDSANSVLFAKAQQWRLVGATLFVHVILVLIVKFVHVNPEFLTGLKLVVLVITPAAILILVI